MKKLYFSFIAVFALSIFVCSAQAETRIFTEPDMKNEFCGVHINFQYCKCAFHDEYCTSIGLDQSGANSHVQSAYTTWVNELRTQFQEACIHNNGIWKQSAATCEYCDGPTEKFQNRCATPEEKDQAEKEAVLAEGPFHEDCSINEDEFSEDWEKYSDIDEAIAVSERSYEAQQYHQIYEQVAEKIGQAVALEHDMERDRLMRLELRAYRTALVKNIKTNLLKAFWRLTYITYSTIKSGKGLGESYAGIVTAQAATPAVIAEGIGVVQSMIPRDSQLAIDGSTDVGKIKSVVMNAELEAMKTAAYGVTGNPKKVAIKVLQDLANLPIPSADITEEEVQILRDQHISKRVIDGVLQESYKQNFLRRNQLQILEQEGENLYAQAEEWKQKEKERTRVLLQESCKELQK